MTIRTLLLSLIAGSVCVACGAGQGGQARRDTLAGTADTTKKPGRAEDREVRLPVAPITASVATDAGDGFGPPDSLEGPAGAAADDPSAPAAVADTSDMPLAPKDAQWTIYCATLAGPDHMATTRALKTSLVKKTGMREWYILHESGQSRLYYGFYRSISDPADAAESRRAKTDHSKIDGLVDGGGERPFRACQFVQLSAPDPESPPDWNLANAPAGKVWTLMIAAYKDHPDRKKAAVESVRDARERGEEAYYYHGDTVSNVFVGAYPDEAVIEEIVDAKEGVNAQDPLLVLPPGMKVPGKVRRKGQAVRAVGQQLVPADPDLQAKIRQYPEMGVNGDTLVYKQNGRTFVQGPVITMIPRPAHAFGPAAAAEEGGDGGADDALDAAPDPFRARGADAAAAPREPGGFRERLRRARTSDGWETSQGFRGVEDR